MDVQTILFILVVVDVSASVVRAIVDVLEYKQNHRRENDRKP
ncbi:MAG: hypothetical protein QXQ50_02125 [Candidatus Bathyarchaeia archaeon]